MRLIRSIIIGTVLIAISGVGSALAETPIVIKAVVDEWAPFGGEELPNRGISLDVMTAVLTRAGYQVEAEIVPWERALNGIKNGHYDVIGNLFPEQSMAPYMVFSDPFYETQVQFIKHKGNNATYSDLDSLKPYSIAVGEGYFYEENFDQANHLDKQVVTTVVQGVRMVANGRVDLTLDSVDVLNYVIHVQEPSLLERVELLPKPLAYQQVHMGIRKGLEGRDQLVADFNRVLNEMRDDGSLEEILKKHKH